MSDPKGNLYKHYGQYLEKKGYVVKKLDFIEPMDSEGHNFFRYIHSTQDIIKLAHMLIYQKKEGGHTDPLWDQASQLLVQAIIAYLKEEWNEEDQNFSRLMQLTSLCELDENDSSAKTPLDCLFEELEQYNPESYACQTYKKFRGGDSRKNLKVYFDFCKCKIGPF